MKIEKTTFNLKAIQKMNFEEFKELYKFRVGMNDIEEVFKRLGGSIKKPKKKKSKEKKDLAKAPNLKKNVAKESAFQKRLNEEKEKRDTN